MSELTLKAIEQVPDRKLDEKLKPMKTGMSNLTTADEFKHRGLNRTVLPSRACVFDFRNAAARKLAVAAALDPQPAMCIQEQRRAIFSTAQISPARPIISPVI